MDGTQTARAVVLGYDGSGEGDPAFDWALREGARRHLPLRVLVAQGPLSGVVPGVGAASPWPDDLAGELVAEACCYAEARAPGVSVASETAVGSPASVLVQASREAELVVVGRRHHTALGEAIVGSTSAQVVAHSACPVVVVDRAYDCPEDGPVVVAVDGSLANEAAIDFAFDRAAQLGVPVVAVHAWWLDVPDRVGISWLSEDRLVDIEHGHHRLLERAIADWVQKYPEVEVRTRMTRQFPVEAVLEAADGAQLIVVGSRGHGGFTGLLLGSVSQGLLHHTRPCPLAVVHSTEPEPS